MTPSRIPITKMVMVELLSMDTAMTAVVAIIDATDKSKPLETMTNICPMTTNPKGQLE